MQAKLKLVPPKPGRTSFWYVRGTYRGTYVERSTGETLEKDARAVLNKIKDDIKRGANEPARKSSGPKFLAAVDAYLDYKAGNLPRLEKRFIERLAEHFDGVAIADIDQAAIDKAAVELLPNAAPATRNREVYTPISSILRNFGVMIVLRRPEGAQGKQRKHWLRPESAKLLLDTAWSLHPRFAALCTLLLYCGCRLSEALNIDIEQLHLDEGFIDLPDTKNDEPQRLYLPPVVVYAIRLALLEPANATWLKPEEPRSAGSLFCLTKSGALYELLDAVEIAAIRKRDAIGDDVETARIEAEIEARKRAPLIPAGVSFHIFRHTYGAWMRTAGQRLEETGRWSSRAGAKPYDHYELSAAARAADNFPGATGGVGPNPKLVMKGGSRSP